MAVDPSDLQAGKCYVTLTGQVRKIGQIKDGKVIYTARGKRLVPEPWSPGSTLANPPTVEKFSSDVEREVECSFEPD